MAELQGGDDLAPGEEGHAAAQEDGVDHDDDLVDEPGRQHHGAPERELHALQGQEDDAGPVITSYSIHYTKLYDLLRLQPLKEVPMTDMD